MALLRRLALVFAVPGALWCSSTGPLCAQGSVGEQYLVSAANQERSAQGIAPLVVDPALSQAALLHAREMAERQELSHQFVDEEGLLTRINVLGVHFDAAAENVAFAPTVVRIHAGWMESEGHRRNILNPTYNAVGIAIVVRGSTVYSVEDFGHLATTEALQRSDEALESPTNTAPSSMSTAEASLFASANQERTQRGLSPLRWDDSLAQAASRHAAAMAQHRGISHQFAGEQDLSERGAAAGTRFTRITENVGEAPDAATIHRAWMNSAGHRENLLDSRVDSVGIAVVVRDRQLYAVQDFAHVTQTLSFDDQEVNVARLLDHRGLGLLPARDDARNACRIDSGYQGRDTPGFIVRYTTDDLGQLPDSLTREIASGRFHQAAVGACPGEKASPFTAYRLAVLLYP